MLTQLLTMTTTHKFPSQAISPAPDQVPDSEAGVPLPLPADKVGSTSQEEGVATKRAREATSDAKNGEPHLKVYGGGW